MLNLCVYLGTGVYMNPASIQINAVLMLPSNKYHGFMVQHGYLASNSGQHLYVLAVIIDSSPLL